MRIALAVAIPAVVAVVYLLERRFYTRQRDECQKYTFFQLRDRIVWEIISSEEPHRYEEVYEAINSVIHHLQRFDFAFYSEAMATALGAFLEKAYERDFQIDDEFMEEFRAYTKEPFVKDFIELILQAAQENSLLIRLATTDLGHKIFLTWHSVGAVIGFLNRHLRDLRRGRNRCDELQIARDYSFVSAATVQA